MLMTTATELMRAFGLLARAADAGLVERATFNAATVVADGQARQLENARTMRDMRRLGFTEEPGSDAAGPLRGH